MINQEHHATPHTATKALKRTPVNRFARWAFVSSLLFIAPIFLFVLVFLLVPIAQTVYLSLTNWQGMGGFQFVGVKNYVGIFHDPTFTNSLSRTLLFGISTAVLANIFGLLFAVIVDQPLRSRNVLRVLFYLPNVIPAVVAAFIWRYILGTNGGVLNAFLSFLTGHEVAIPWLDSPKYVLGSIVVIQTWQMIGPIMIVYIAALQGVPHELIESAMIDGAGRFKRFFRIALPLMAPGITVNVLIGLANGMQFFNLPYALTQGGPANASETMAIRVYDYAFNSINYTYGMAASFVLTIVVLVITFSFIGLSRKYELEVQK